MRAFTAFSATVSSSRRWKPSRRQELRNEWRAATHNDNDDDNGYERDGFASESELFDDERSILTIEASYSSTTGGRSVVLGDEEGASSARTPTSVSSSLVLLEYRSAHSSSAPNLLASYSSASRSGVELSALSDTEANSQPQQPNGGSARLQTPLLFPVLVVPQQVSRATEIQLFLDRIEYIEINNIVVRDDIVYYVLDVFRHRQQNGIPTRRRAASAASLQRASKLQAPRLAHSSSSNSSSGVTSASGSSTSGSRLREPDYQIEHRYSSFARLRSNVRQIASRRHRGGASCSYCDALVAFFEQSDAQPSLRVKFRCTSPETRKALLSAFINALLVVTRDNHVRCVRSRRGYHQIPVLMKRFFNEQSGENFFA